MGTVKYRTATKTMCVRDVISKIQTPFVSMLECSVFVRGAFMMRKRHQKILHCQMIMVRFHYTHPFWHLRHAVGPIKLLRPYLDRSIDWNRSGKLNFEIFINLLALSQPAILSPSISNEKYKPFSFFQPMY